MDIKYLRNLHYPVRVSLWPSLWYSLYVRLKYQNFQPKIIMLFQEPTKSWDTHAVQHPGEILSIIVSKGAGILWYLTKYFENEGRSLQIYSEKRWKHAKKYSYLMCHFLVLFFNITIYVYTNMHTSLIPLYNISTRTMPISLWPDIDHSSTLMTASNH